ncbi:thermophilic beta-amylase [Gracilibacillus halophilus YIM-C55.5]|uniref:Beta-amylase n=1 Tax=Gracilibacillus halophilus YIM-C55.5 TaxID=1308866 RepID=N4WC35_9BACI|nr:family 14 glycosylhydrolase [Gracilibacillus halophilus]ENH97848.1 thermophilic beta-amylase [Gracilibacillus halophilus YIM-C55.5]
MKKIINRIVIGLLIIGFVSNSFYHMSTSADISSDYEPYVMAPLTKITDWSSFTNQLETLKENGVHAITTDVWWGDVESEANNQFDWSYYKQYAEVVKDAGLKWVPILSTHQCGGNVGDDCNIPLPDWIWNLDSHDTLTQKSETGYINKETLSPWANQIIETQYQELYQSFAQHFSQYKETIDKIYISTGPAGELRYSSYASSDNWNYPERGKFQAYSDIAKQDFRESMKQKYDNLSQLNTAWETNLTSWNQVSPPTDGNQFFTSGAAYQSTYGDDFLTWYQHVLTNHLSLVADIAHSNFDDVFHVPIGAKIAGIHWKMNDPQMPHAAEYSAGYYNYSQILDQFKASDLQLTFTALEMDNSNAETSPYYSEPKTLVTQIASLAADKKITINGENALAISSNDANYSISRYQNIAQHLFNEDFKGFTLLRLQNIVHENGSPTNEMNRFINILGVTPIQVNFIVKNAPTSYGDTVHLTGNRWEMGKWNSPNGQNIKLSWDSSNQDWRGSAYIAADRYYEMKAIIVGANGEIKQWEPGANHTWASPHHSTNYTIEW